VPSLEANARLPAAARVLDLGCGGGLLAEPLAAQGHRVLGVDASHQSLRCANARTAPPRGTCHYVRADLLRTPTRDGVADLVLLADVLEHLPNPHATLAEVGRLLRPGGLCYINTVNRTFRARLFAVTLGEGLGFVPRGTHDPALFVKPSELHSAARNAGLTVEAIQGEAPKLGASLRQRRLAFGKTRSLAVSYSALLVKDHTRGPRCRGADF
jgi:2-polyprenyl-6-hydroxyphenyl methylase/3-demethylubiquinone-9 3-methyltransferase